MKKIMMLKNICGLFPSDFKNRFTSLHQLIKEKRGTYLFMIMNTERNNKKVAHWWSILELHPRKQIFFLMVVDLKI